MRRYSGADTDGGDAMFLVLLTYTVDLAEIDAALPEHVAWLDRQYADGVFVASGRRRPRTGGFIAATGVDEAELRARLAEDPFSRRGYADYAVHEIEVSRVASGLDALMAGA